MSCQKLGAAAGSEGVAQHSHAHPMPWLTVKTGNRMHRGTGMSLLGTIPLALWCSQQFPLLAPDHSPGHGTRVPPPNPAVTGASACPKHPSSPQREDKVTYCSHPGVAPGHTGDMGHGAPPRGLKGRSTAPPGSGAHPCLFPMGEGQRRQRPPESCREHPGDGKWLRVTMETGPLARHAEGTRVLRGHSC